METPPQTIWLDFSQPAHGPAGPAACYTSPVIDGGEADATWHRLRLEYAAPPGAVLRVSLYASNGKRLIHRGAPVALDALLADPALTEAERDEGMRAALVRTERNPSDLLLHGIRGRYFWFRLHISGPLQVTRLSVSYPAQSPLSHFPEIYQAEPLQSSFADQYLSLLQSLYDDLEEEIDQSSALLDAKSCPPRFLPWLADWLGLDDPDLWQDGALRRVIELTPRLFRIRGTIPGMKLLFSLCCDAQYFFVEGWHVMRYDASPLWPVLSRLFSPTRFSFWVLAVGEISEAREMALRRLLERNKPAHTTARLRVLKRRTVLDHDSFLGINTALSSVRPAYLDGRSPLGAVRTGSHRQ